MRAAATFSPGQIIVHEGIYYEVASDDDDSVTLIVPEVSRPLRGGALRLAVGNTITISKGDLVLEGFS